MAWFDCRRRGRGVGSASILPIPGRRETTSRAERSRSMRAFLCMTAVLGSATTVSATTADSIFTLNPTEERAGGRAGPGDDVEPGLGFAVGPRRCVRPQ